MEQTEQTENNLPENVFQLILQSGNFGIQGAKRLFSIGFLFGVTNLLLIAYGLYSYFGKASESAQGIFILVIIVLGILFTVFAIYKAYQYVMVEIFGYAYAQSTGVFKKVSEVIVTNSDKLLHQASENTSVAKAIDYGSIVKQKIDNAPRFLSKAVAFLLKRIPLLAMLKKVQTEVSNGNTEAASNRLYAEIDSFINQNIFDSNTTKWVYWMLPLNILIMLAIIYLKLS